MQIYTIFSIQLKNLDPHFINKIFLPFVQIIIKKENKFVMTTYKSNDFRFIT